MALAVPENRMFYQVLVAIDKDLREIAKNLNRVADELEKTNKISNELKNENSRILEISEQLNEKISKNI